VCNYMGLSGPIVVVSDSNVAPLYADSAIESLETAGYKTKLHVIPAGETYKTMRTVEDIWDSLLNAHLERSSTVIALGGGVTGDITGFAAATYLRGLNWVCVPTSVLAMVDASLGGKTGIDHNRGKNLIGAFYPPRFVLVDPEVLGTLPEEEIRSGMAEVIKHGVIGDPKLFDLCRQNPDRDVNSFPEIIRRAMAVKVKVLLLDPFEKDIRATLNFGHTLGHGIEKASEYTIRHGEAVSIGMVAATKLAERLDTAANGLSDELIDVLMRNGLPISIPKTISKEKALEAIRVDKKRKAGKIPLVLPVQIGEVKFGFEIDDINQLFDD
jgi:3-dehydroquinate synthase